MKYAYYPGCSLRGTGRAYEESLLAVFRALEVEVEELDDWNCCGATTYMSFDELQSYALAARNLSLATKGGNDLMAPCSACYLVLNKTQYYVRDYPWIGQIVDHASGHHHLPRDISVKVRHPLDILLNDVGLDAIRAKVTHPLKGLKVAPYYGCQIVRPYALFDNQRNPTSMDRLLEACGAKIVYFPVKTHCCGGSQKGTLPEIGLDLIKHLLTEAHRNEAEVISTVCPLCQFNLEAFEEEASNAHQFHMPILYFTQLLAVAFGIPLKRGWVPALIRQHQAGSCGEGNRVCLMLRNPDTTPRIGVYVCHCGTNIAGTVDVQALTEVCGQAARRGGLAGIQVHVLRPGPGVDPAGHPRARPQPDRGGIVLAADARTHVPRRAGEGAGSMPSFCRW